MALNSLGIVCHDQGDYVAARQYYRQAAHISRQVGDRQHEGAALHNLGLIFRIERNFSEALTCYQQALDIAREIDARLFESYTLNSLGSILRAQGDYAEAKRYYEQSLHIKRELGDRPGQASALGNLGVVSRSLGDYVTAESHFVQSLCLFRDTGDRQGEAICLADLSLLHHCLGDDPAARESARQAVHLSQELGHRGNQAEALINLGRAELGLGHLAEATSAFRQAQTLLRELSRHYMEILPVTGLASVALAQGDLHQVGTHAEALWAYLQDHFPDGNYDPFWVYLTCYQGLEANGDPRAEAIVTTAYILLQERAAKIDDAMLRRSFLENVTANRELIAAYQAFQATPRERQITVHLPRADAPPGRSLRDDEYVTVTWTFTAPDDFTIQDRTARRRCRLLRLLSEAQTQGALPRDADLAEALDVSLATVRRDVAALRAAGHVLPARRRKHTA
jgi:tetratricopeptide (TPR) repeat protein